MKIYYMTGTGNSLKTARDIGTGLGDCELISMPQLIKKSKKVIIEGETVGFVFPVYLGRPPVFLRDFFNIAEFGDTSYIFAVANGGGIFGRTVGILKTLLRKKGKSLNAAFTLRMPGNYPYISLLHRKSHEELYKKAAEQTVFIVNTVKNGREHKSRQRFMVLGSIYSFFAFDILYDLSKHHSMDRHFWINDACRNCGLCIDICPVGNIVQSRWKPAWQHRCINCFACYNLCPLKGIELRYDWKMIELVTHEQQIYRYRHPDISVEDLINR